MWSRILNPEIEVWKGEVVNRAKDGRFVPVLLTITPYKLKGLTVGYMAIAVDLTERRSMERQILRQDRLASIGMLASSLAHEIGNPLGVIRGRAEIILNSLRSGLPSIEASLQGLDTIVGQIDRIARLIESLLKLSRVPQEIRLTVVPLSGLTIEVATLMAESLRQKGIELHNRLQSSTISVMADSQHLQQILLNLIINSSHAIDEEKKRSGRLENHYIRLDAKALDSSHVTLVVEDTGCGMSSDVKRRIFEPFFTTKTPGQGTGLGLAIVHRLVDEMHGSIEVQSDGPGLGAKVLIQLRSSSPSSSGS
jgi:signal transduction histidine kinase